MYIGKREKVIALNNPASLIQKKKQSETGNMFTHKDYVIAGKCTHQQYYAQFVTEEIRMMVVLNFGLDALREAYQKDRTFNTIPLHRWDSLGIFLNIPTMHDKFKQHQDFISQANIVCVLKEAARQVVT